MVIEDKAINPMGQFHWYLFG